MRPRRRSGSPAAASAKYAADSSSRHPLDASLDAHLAPERRLPVEDDAACGFAASSRRLAALAVGVEDEPALVVPAEEHHADGGMPSGVGVASAIASGSGAPAAAPPRATRSRLRVRVGVELVEVGVHAASVRRVAAGYASAWQRPRRSRFAPRSPAHARGSCLPGESASVARPLQVHLPVFAERAEGATITDVDGNTFVDFAGGVGVINVGHSHPRVVEAITEQAARFLHTDFTVVPYARLRRARRAALRARSRSAGERAGRVLQRRHRGGRERRQARAARTRAARR